MDEWLNTPGKQKMVTIKKYIDKLKGSLSNVRKIAREKLNKAKISTKTNFDKTKAKDRKFKTGDLVLAYFPVIGSPLQSRFLGHKKISEERE